MIIDFLIVTASTSKLLHSYGCLLIHLNIIIMYSTDIKYQQLSTMYFIIKSDMHNIMDVKYQWWIQAGGGGGGGDNNLLKVSGRYV